MHSWYDTADTATADTLTPIRYTISLIRQYSLICLINLLVDLLNFCMLALSVRSIYQHEGQRANAYLTEPIETRQVG
jgi:hypothetical protein